MDMPGRELNEDRDSGIARSGNTRFKFSCVFKMICVSCINLINSVFIMSLFVHNFFILLLALQEICRKSKQKSPKVSIFHVYD